MEDPTTKGGRSHDAAAPTAAAHKPSGSPSGKKGTKKISAATARQAGAKDAKTARQKAKKEVKAARENGMIGPGNGLHARKLELVNGRKQQNNTAPAPARPAQRAPSAAPTASAAPNAAPTKRKKGESKTERGAPTAAADKSAAPISSPAPAAPPPAPAPAAAAPASQPAAAPSTSQAAPAPAADSPKEVQNLGGEFPAFSPPLRSLLKGSRAASHRSLGGDSSMSKSTASPSRVSFADPVEGAFAGTASVFARCDKSYSSSSAGRSTPSRNRGPGAGQSATERFAGGAGSRLVQRAISTLRSGGADGSGGGGSAQLASQNPLGGRPRPQAVPHLAIRGPPVLQQPSRPMSMAPAAAEPRMSHSLTALEA